MAANLAKFPKDETPAGLFEIPGCEFKSTSLNLPKGLSFDHWERIGRQLQLADLAVQWWIGDWLNYGECRYGEKYAQAVEEFGRKKQTLMNYAFVARSIEISRRREIVDFSTHAEVAGLEPEDQDRVLAKAAKEHLSRNNVRRVAEKIKREGKERVKDTAYVLSKEARNILDEYMQETALWVEKLPLGISGSERAAIEKMIYGHGGSSLWLKNRTFKTDRAAIEELFSFEEGTPGIERASRADISAWLEKCSYFMSDADLDERLDLMIEDKVLQVKSVEDSRQDGRRGVMIDLYALHPDYEAQLDNVA